MADFMLTGGADFSQAERALAQLYRKLESYQKAATAAGKGNSRTPTLSKDLTRQIAQPGFHDDANLVGRSAAAVRKRNQAIQDGVRAQAKRTALLEQELRMQARLAGIPDREVTKQVRDLRGAARAGLAASTGQTTKQFSSSELGKSFNAQIASFSREFSSAMSAMTLAQRTAFMNQQAASIGAPLAASTRAVKNVDYSDPYQAQTVAAHKQEAEASQQAATAASQGAASTKASEAAQTQAQAQTTANTQREAAATKRSADAAVKLSAAQQKALAAILAKPGITPAELKAQGIRPQTIKALTAREMITSKNGGFSAVGQEVVPDPTPKPRRKLSWSESGNADAERKARKASQAAANAAAIRANTPSSDLASEAGERTPGGQRIDSLLNRRRAAEEVMTEYAEIEAAIKARTLTANRGIEAILNDRLRQEAANPGSNYTLATTAQQVTAAQRKAQETRNLVNEPGYVDAERARRAADRDRRAATDPDADRKANEAAIKEETRQRRARDKQRTAEARARDTKASQEAKAWSTLEAKRRQANDKILSDAQRNTRYKRDAGPSMLESTAQARTNQQLVGGIGRYSADQAINLDTEKRIIGQQIKQLKAEIASGNLSEQEVAARNTLVNNLRKQAKAASAVASGAKVTDQTRPFIDTSPTAGPRLSREQEVSRRAQVAEMEKRRQAQLLASDPNFVDQQKSRRAAERDLRAATDPDAERKAQEKASKEAKKANDDAIKEETRQRRARDKERTAKVRQENAAWATQEAKRRQSEQKVLSDAQKANRYKRPAGPQAVEATAYARSQQQLVSGIGRYGIDQNINIDLEKQIIGEQIKQLKAEISSGRLSQEEVAARNTLVNGLRRQAKAAQAVVSGTTGSVPYRDQIRPYVDNTPAPGPRLSAEQETNRKAHIAELNSAQRKEAKSAAQAAMSQTKRAETLKKAASETGDARRETLAGLRNTGLSAASRRLDQFHKENETAAKAAYSKEARKRISGESLAPDQYGASTNFTREKGILSAQKALLSRRLNTLSATNSNEAEQQALSEQITALTRREAQLRAAQNALIKPTASGSGGGPTVPPTKRGGFGGFIDKFRQGNQYDNAGSFFGRGALSSIQYGLPSMLMYGAASGIADSIREAEELQYVFARLKGQVESTFGADSKAILDSFKQTIIDSAVEYGLAADELGKTGLKIIGTFSKRNIDGLQGPDLANAQIESLAKLERVTGLTAKELENNYSAISIAFNKTFEEIGDSVVAISDVTGVDAGELGQFAGDIATVLKEAGFSIDEALALGATSAQSSGKTMGTIAEAYGRVLPDLQQKTSELLALSATSPELQTPEFLDAVRLKDSAEVLLQIGSAYNQLSKDSQTKVIDLLGRREAQSVLPGLINQQGYSDALESAANSTNKLDDRTALVMETLSARFAKLGEEVRVVFKRLLEAGLGDFLQALVSIASVTAKMFSGILGILSKINTMTDGWLGTMLLVVGALKVTNALWTKIAATQMMSNFTGMFGGGLGSKSAAGRGFGRFVPNFALDARSAYNYQRNPFRSTMLPKTPPMPGYMGGAIPPLQGPQLPAKLAAGKMSALGAGGKSVLASIGGGSVAGGAAFLGVGAVVGAYAYINSRIDAANKAVEELAATEKAEADKILAKMGDTPETRDVIAGNYRDAANDAARRQGNFNKLLASVFNVQTEQQKMLIEELKILFDTEQQDSLTNLSTTDAGRDFATNLLGANFLEGKDLATLKEDLASYADTRADIQDTRKAVVKQLKDASGDDKKRLQEDLKQIDAVLNGERDSYVLSTGGEADITQPVITDSISLPKIDKDSKRFLDTFKKNFGMDFLSLSDAARQKLTEVLLSDNPARALQEAINDEDLKNDKTADPLFKIAEELTKQGNLDPAVKDAAAALDPTGNYQKAIGDIDKAYEAGVISLNTYAKKKAQAAADLRRLQSEGNVAPNAEEVQGLAAAEKASTEAASAAAGATLDAQIQVLERYSSGSGDDETAVLMGKISRINAAISSGSLSGDQLSNFLGEWFESQREIVTTAMANAKSPEEAIRIGEEGFKIPAGIRAAAIIEYIDKVSGSWTEIDKFFNEYYGETGKAYVNRIIRDFETGQATKEQTIAELMGRLAELQSLRQRAANDVGWNAFDKRSVAQAEAGRQARLEAIDGMIDGVSSVLGGIDLADPGMAQKVKDDEARSAIDKTAEAKASYDKAVANRNAVQIAQIEKAEADRKLAEVSTLPEAEQGAARWAALEAGVRADQAMIAAIKGIYDAQIGYLKAVAEASGDTAGVLELEAARIQNDINDAMAAGDEAGVWAGMASQVANTEAMRQRAIRQRGLDLDLFATASDAEGMVVEAATIRLQKAQEALGNARGDEQIRAAQAELISAQVAVRQAVQQRRDAEYSLANASIEDPVALARQQLAQAQQQLADAKGIDALGAQQRVIEAEKAVNAAMQNARQARFSLRQAELQAMDDDVGAAQVAAEAARAQLQDAIARGAGSAEIDQARANLITAEKQATDTMINDRMDDYKWLLDMGQITKSQYISYLEALKSEIAPGTKQFKDLELTLKQLKGDISGDLQANLPTSLALPTLYEVRRLNQLGSMSAPGVGATAGGIGYQDNRVVDITIQTMGNDVTDQVVDVLYDALGSNRSGSAPRRY